jgi:hypothetical protein
MQEKADFSQENDYFSIVALFLPEKIVCRQSWLINILNL